MNILKRFIPYIIVIILSFFAFQPILNPWTFPIHDDTQITRVFEMTNALRDGMIPVRWSMNLGFGFGYPIFNFYAPLAYYIGGIISIFGLNALEATKAMMLIGILIAGVTMYVLAKEFFGKIGGILSAILYMYAPYHGINIFVRGAVAEFFAYGFIPLLFYGLYLTYKEKRFIYVAITAISYALIIVSHNLTALMVTPFALFFALFLIFKDKSNIYRFIISFILGLSLSSFYFIPALLEMDYTNVLSQVGGGSDFRDHFVCLSQLWTSQWGYGGSAKGCIDGLSFMIGKSHLILSIIVVISISFYLFTKKIFKFSKKDISDFPIIFIFALFAVFSILLMLEISKPVWEILKPMEFFQFPWRFLIITVFSLSFIAGAVTWLIKGLMNKNAGFALSVLLIVLVIFLNAKFFTPQHYSFKSLDQYTSVDNIKWDISKISSEYMPSNFKKPIDPIDVANFNNINSENVELVSYTQKTNKIDLRVSSDQNLAILIPLAYFPAWQAYVNRQRTDIKQDPRGIRVNINKGENEIILKFAETKVERAANILSLAGLLSLIIGIIYSRKRYGKI